MTREDQEKKAAQAYAFHAEAADVSRFTHCSRGFQEGIKWADANRWVKVEDATPEYGVLYDIVIDGFSSGIGIHNGKKWFGKTWDCDFLKEHDTVTHFSIRSPLPLPSPPKAEQ